MEKHRFFIFLLCSCRPKLVERVKTLTRRTEKKTTQTEVKSFTYPGFERGLREKEPNDLASMLTAL